MKPEQRLILVVTEALNELQLRFARSPWKGEDLRARVDTAFRLEVEPFLQLGAREHGAAFADGVRADLRRELDEMLAKRG